MVGNFSGKTKIEVLNFLRLVLYFYSWTFAFAQKDESEEEKGQKNTICDEKKEAGNGWMQLILQLKRPEWFDVISILSFFCVSECKKKVTRDIPLL